MDDRQIRELARMAVEIESLECGDESIPFAAAQASPARRLLVGAGLGLAAAACLVVAVVAMRPAASSRSATNGPLAANNGATGEASASVVPVPKERCVVMAMFRDPSGHCSCTQVSEPEWGDGRGLADVSRGELRRVALREPCDTEAQQVLIVAVAGRGDAVPRNHEQAQALVQQVSTAAASVGPHADVSSLARAAIPALGDASIVVADTVSMRQPSRVKDFLEGTTGLR
jgi:hypothetical protein